ncbi:MAG: arsenosugar biosynthesis radical SAM protein ArsS [Verrucomicrobia bacterium]|nr:arsenosugar biosynthesis radical SAM protein ArsS [Verrucomicrobiota bacterium]
MNAEPRNAFARTLERHQAPLARAKTRVLQVNVGKLCNLTCAHCHVNAGPKRKEIMTRETVDRILAWLVHTDIPVVDLTGGAPEMIPDFRYFVERLSAMTPRRHVMDRCNLTILLEPSQDGLAEFLAEHHVEIVASMPCYSPANVDAQRGDGVFDASIKALQLLNHLGYGHDEALPLNLVYNPLGASMPGPQRDLEEDYKRELLAHFGIVFDKLYTITNVPVSRFASHLRHNGQLQQYLDLLVESFNPQAVGGLMCRDTINVSWTGEVFDCDFNQMLKMQWRDQGRGLHLWELDLAQVEGREILTGDHCFACTAGAGSSCGGALV